MASGSYIQVHVGCPFYREDERASLKCEGLGESITTNLSFKTKFSKQDHMEKYCCSHYGNCPLYKALMKSKYPDYYSTWERKDGCTEKTQGLQHSKI